jgi:endonuclease/exonuclease/phosphatase family metal-dependent hydrolase
MKNKLPRLAFKIIFLVITSLVLLLYIPALFSIWISPSHLWLMGFLTLLFPYTATVLLLLCFFWFITKPKIGWLVLIMFLLGFKHYSVIFSIKPGKDFSIKKDKNNIRIISWNVQSFNGLSKNKEAKKNIKSEIVKCINNYKPDIVCLQEFNSSSLSSESNSLELFKQYYPFFYFSKDYSRKQGGYNSGCIIFSIYPILNKGKIKYPNAESLIYADILVNADTIRVYTTHLQSFKFKKDDYAEIENISQNKETSKTRTRNLFIKMSSAFKNRATQATIIKNETTKTNLPSVICGDFNDVPSSFTYYTVKGNRQDAFINNMFGIGRTFTSLAPTLRIDYIFPDKTFLVSQFDLVDENLSDHIMLVSDLKLNKNGVNLTN